MNDDSSFNWQRLKAQQVSIKQVSDLHNAKIPEENQGALGIGTKGQYGLTGSGVVGL